jgi:hypothetical protein
MNTVHVTNYSCSKCNSKIVISKSFIEHGDLVAVCSACQTKQTLAKGMKCDRCLDTAVQVKWVHGTSTTSGSEVLNPIYRCPAHPLNGAFGCSNCGTLLQHELILLRDGNLIAQCTNCKAEIIIKANVKCEKYSDGANYVDGNGKPLAPCANQATHFKWDIDPGSGLSSGSQIPYFRCDEHRDKPPASKQERIKTGILHLLIAGGCLAILVATNKIFPEPKDDTLILNLIVLAVYVFAGPSLFGFSISGLYNLIKGLSLSE